MSIDRHTGGHVPKRQARYLVHDVAQDFEAFYAQKRFVEPEKTQDLLVLSFDAKGIVMRHNSLRAATKKAAEVKGHKLQTRLSQREKRHRKRMAQVATVYTVTPCMRTAESIMNKKRDNVTYLRPKIRKTRIGAIDKAFHFLGINYSGPQSWNGTNNPPALTEGVTQSHTEQYLTLMGAVQQKPICQRLSKTVWFHMNDLHETHVRMLSKWLALEFLSKESRATYRVGVIGGCKQ